jgi:hypothetical protein
LGKNWFDEQLARPVEKQNAIVRGRSALLCLLKKPGDANEALNTGHTLTGPVKAYLCFAYDLCWLQLVNKLPETLITRLKRPGYQGARYEVLIAAVFARAGFDIEWIDDKKATDKHPEFIATHKRTGKRVGVETKSRKRPGTYDFRGSVSPETHLKGDVFGLYETAVKQAPQEGMPFLIFIDANVPATVAPGVPPHGDLPVDNFPWMKAIRRPGSLRGPPVDAFQLRGFGDSPSLAFPTRSCASISLVSGNHRSTYGPAQPWLPWS